MKRFFEVVVGDETYLVSVIAILGENKAKLECRVHEKIKNEMKSGIMPIVDYTFEEVD